MAAQWDMAFEAEIIEWRGPPPYLFAVVPDELVGEIRYAAREASYGWGMVPVTRAERVGLGDRFVVMMQISRVIRR